jgi:hypothetical protein
MKRLIITFFFLIMTLFAGEPQYAFFKLGEIESNGSTTALDVDDLDRIFVADGTEGLKVYSFDIINGFKLIASIDNGGTAVDVAVKPDGQTVFLANNSDGMRVYSFNHHSLENIYHSGTGVNNNQYTQVDIATTNRIYVENETNIMVISHTKWTDLMRPRTYEYGSASIIIWDGEEATNPNNGEDVRYGHMYPRDPYDGFPGRISDYEPFDQDSDLLACGGDGIKHDYRGDGPRKNTGNFVRDIHVLDDGTILIANSEGGLKAYDYTDQFVLTAQIDEGGMAIRLHENSDGILFLANGADGLRAYGFDTTFHALAHAYDGGNVKDIVELSDGTMIVANELGLIAYSFADTSKNNNGGQSMPDVDGYALTPNYPNPFNISTRITYMIPKTENVIIQIFNTKGVLTRSWNIEDQTLGIYEITWNGKDQNGSPVPSGIYIYRMVAGEYVQSIKMVLLK